MKSLLVISLFLASHESFAAPLKPIRLCKDFRCNAATGEQSPSDPVCLSSYMGFLHHFCLQDRVNRRFESEWTRVPREVVEGLGYNPREIYKRPATKATSGNKPSTESVSADAACYTDEHPGFKVEFDSKGRPKLYLQVAGSKPETFKWVEEKNGLSSSTKYDMEKAQNKSIYKYKEVKYTVVTPVPTGYSKEGILIQDGPGKEILLFNDKTGCHLGREYDTNELKVKWDRTYCADVEKLARNAGACSDLAGKISKLVDQANENIKKDLPNKPYQLGIDLSSVPQGQKAFEGLMASGEMCRRNPESDLSDAATPTSELISEREEGEPSPSPAK